MHSTGVLDVTTLTCREFEHYRLLLTGNSYDESLTPVQLSRAQIIEYINNPEKMGFFHGRQDSEKLISRWAEANMCDQYEGDAFLTPKNVARSAWDNGFKPVPLWFNKPENEWIRNRFINKKTNEYGYNPEHFAWNASSMPFIPLVMLNNVLVDLDANKDDCEFSIGELKAKCCEVLGVDIDTFEAGLFQANANGDSLHYLFIFRIV